MRAYVTNLLLAFGIWFCGAQAPLFATERAPDVDVYDYAGRFRLGQDGVITFHVTCGELSMSSLSNASYSLNKIAANRYSTTNGELTIIFHSVRLAEIVRSNGTLEAMAVRMAEGEKVPREHILDGNFDEAIQAYLEQYEKDPMRQQFRSQDIKRAADQLRREGRLEESLVMLGLLSIVYPEEAMTFRGLGDVYLTLAIDSYREYGRLSGEHESKSLALEYILEHGE